MGKRNGRRGKLQQISFAPGQRNEAKFEAGPYWYGEGYSYISDEIDRREFIWGLSPADLWTLLLLTRDAHLKKSLYVRAAAGYLASKTGISKRNMERLLGPNGNLRRRGFTRLHKPDRDEGNVYFVEPVLIWSSNWHELDGIAVSRCLQGTMPRQPANRQNGGTEARTAKMAVPNRQNGGWRSASAGTAIRQDGGEISNDLTRSNGASRHSSKKIAGGVHAEQGKRRSPAGHDRKNRKALEGAAHRSDLRSGVSRLHAAVEDRRRRRSFD
jgi:hypothetical protein